MSKRHTFNSDIPLTENFREDCYHLDRLLPHFSEDEILSTEKLTEIFNAFANLRQPRTAALVKGARAQGEYRVVDGGAEACLARDQKLRKNWQDGKAVRQNMTLYLGSHIKAHLVEQIKI